MRRAITLAACLCVLFLLVTSARADSFRADDMTVKLNNSEGHHQLDFKIQARAELLSLFGDLFENDNGLHLGLLKNDNGRHVGLFDENDGNNGNNGKRLGFSVASVNRGNKFGLFKGPQTSAGGGATIPNPEPAAVFLLGTGLAAAGAYARKRFRKSSH
jgi:hypothetical protein